MCWSAPGRVLEVADGAAVVDQRGRRRTVSLLALEAPVRPGDWVLVQSGLALATVSADEARAALALQTEVEETLP